MKHISIKHIYVIKKAKKIVNIHRGGINMEATLRNNKVLLKSLLMKNVKTDKIGRVLLSKDDEWRNETEWDIMYQEELKSRKE